MAYEAPPGIDRIRALADSLDCILEEDFQALADVKPGTAEAWRKRGLGPAYIRLGNRVLYQRAAVAEFLKKQVRERAPVAAAGQL